MIFIRQGLINNNTIDIHVDGILNNESLPILERVCEEHIRSGRTVVLHKEGLSHITREGRDYLTAISPKIRLSAESASDFRYGESKGQGDERISNPQQGGRT